MQIIKRKDNNLVVFAEQRLTLDKEGASGKGWTTTTVNSDTHTLYEVDALPENFIGNGYAHTGGAWEQNAHGAEYQRVIELKESTKEKTLEERLLAIEAKVDPLTEITK